MERYVIALDAMGGDHAPDATVGGAVQALRRFEDISMILTGPKDRIEALLAGADDVRRRIEIVDCDEVITMDEHPMMAVRKKVNSSMVQAMLAVREKRADAAVSAGSTGALLACGMLRVGRIPGIERPALAPVLPGANGPFLLIDSGANVDCQPKYLTQFGLMGSVYMSAVMGVKEPKVGLVNIGTETEKGNKLTKETFQMMSAQTGSRFAGNCEAREVPTGDFDVVVADGFDGNIILKYTEGIVSVLLGMIKKNLKSSVRTTIGAFLCKPGFRKLKKSMSSATQHNTEICACLASFSIIIKFFGNISLVARIFCKRLINETRIRQFRMISSGIFSNSPIKPICNHSFPARHYFFLYPFIQGKHHNSACISVQTMYNKRPAAFRKSSFFTHDFFQKLNRSTRLASRIRNRKKP